MFLCIDISSFYDCVYLIPEATDFVMPACVEEANPCQASRLHADILWPMDEGG